MSIERAADVAIALDRPILYDHRIWLLPDTIEVEAAANGLPPLPPTWRMQRDDGRSVLVFAAREESAA